MNTNGSRGEPGMILTGAELRTLGTGRHNDSHAWGQRQRYGVLAGLYLTVNELGSNPLRFYERLDPESGVTPDLIYALAMTLISVLPALALQTGTGAGAWLQRPPVGDLLARLGPVLSTLLPVLASLVLIPLFALLTLFFFAGFLHLILILLRWNPSPARVTAKVVCYAQTAHLLNWIPACGGLLSLVAALALMGVGVRVMHGLTPLRSTVAVVTASLPVGLVIFALSLLAQMV